MPKGRVASPYVKYQKAPYIYSEAYQKWRAAILRGEHKSVIHELGDAHWRRVRS